MSSSGRGRWSISRRRSSSRSFCWSCPKAGAATSASSRTAAGAPAALFPLHPIPRPLSVAISGGQENPIRTSGAVRPRCVAKAFLLKCATKMTDLFLGIDLGGTFVKLGVCTPGGEVRGTLSIPTRPDRGPEDTVQRIGEAADALQRKTGRVKACCAGVPGPLDLERRILMRANNLPGGTNVRFPQMLGNRLGMPTYMENDANCAAWGEYVTGAGKGVQSMVLYTLGTGVGGGIILSGDRSEE